jgi:UDP-N-acetylglucosamine transferase subunit ALG13
LTKVKKNNIRILISPLDWGLGHATRSIPVIHELLNAGCEVFIAGSGAQQVLLQESFPAASFLPLPGYGIQYSHTKHGLAWKILSQLPRIQRSIRFEHRWLQQMVKKYNIQAVISDNRYGLFHPDIPTVFITHQLQVKAPWRWLEKLIQRINYRYIARFSECWVPDMEGSDNLAGDLSHPVKKPANLHYIGCLSRFLSAESIPPVYDLLLLLSGPEPQRTLLEQQLLSELANFEGKALLVRGLPGTKSILPALPNTTIYPHLPAEALNLAIRQAGMVISRPGYTTVMDLAKLGKKALFIPTPGQTEQEYLANYLQQQGYCYAVSQDTFRLSTALAAAGQFNYHLPHFSNAQMEGYKDRIRIFLEDLTGSSK